MAIGGLSGIIALICAQQQPLAKPGMDENAAVALHHSKVAQETKAHHRMTVQAKGGNPIPALTRALVIEDRMVLESSVRDLLSAWAVRDAEAALEWAMELKDSTVRSGALANVCLKVAESDPRRAVDLALAHGADEEDQGGLLESLTMQWCDKDSETVLNWAREQPPGEWRERLLARVSYVLSKSEPLAAAQLVSDLEPGPQQNEAAMAVLHQWAMKDPSAALKWAEAFGEPTLHKRALEEISNLQSWIAARDHE